MGPKWPFWPFSRILDNNTIKLIQAVIAPKNYFGLKKGRFIQAYHILFFSDIAYIMVDNNDSQQILDVSRVAFTDTDEAKKDYLNLKWVAIECTPLIQTPNFRGLQIKGVRGIAFLKSSGLISRWVQHFHPSDGGGATYIPFCGTLLYGIF